MKIENENGSRALITLAEAAGRLRVAYNTARAMVAAGQIPHVRLGRRVMVTEADLAQFIAARRQA